MKSYAIRHISLFSAFRFGFVIGCVSLLLPAILLGIGAGVTITLLLDWFKSWKEIASLGFEIRPLDLLKLTALLAWLERMAAWGWRLPLLVAAGLISGGGIGYGITAMLSAATYNFLASLSGGLVVELEEVGDSSSQNQPRGSYPASGPALYASNGQRWPLSPAGAVVGSAPGSTILLPGLPPRHAEIRFENNAYYVLYDLSGGQTWVDGRPIHGANLLKPGFRVRFGSYEFVFQQEV